MLLVPHVIVAILVKLTSKASSLHWPDSAGKDNANVKMSKCQNVKMSKFRSMEADTPAVATHLFKDSTSALMPIGGFLLRSRLDELT
jgi:O-antigen biosynthesis protein WbqP